MLPSKIHVFKKRSSKIKCFHKTLLPHKKNLFSFNNKIFSKKIVFFQNNKVNVAIFYFQAFLRIVVVGVKNKPKQKYVKFVTFAHVHN